MSETKVGHGPVKVSIVINFDIMTPVYSIDAALKKRGAGNSCLIESKVLTPEYLAFVPVMLGLLGNDNDEKQEVELQAQKEKFNKKIAELETEWEAKVEALERWCANKNSEVGSKALNKRTQSHQKYMAAYLTKYKTLTAWQNKKNLELKNEETHLSRKIWQAQGAWRNFLVQLMRDSHFQIFILGADPAIIKHYLKTIIQLEPDLLAEINIVSALPPPTVNQYVVRIDNSHPKGDDAIDLMTPKTIFFDNLNYLAQENFLDNLTQHFKTLKTPLFEELLMRKKIIWETEFKVVKNFMRDYRIWDGINYKDNVPTHIRSQWELIKKFEAAEKRLEQTLMAIQAEGIKATKGSALKRDPKTVEYYNFFIKQPVFPTKTAEITNKLVKDFNA